MPVTTTVPLNGPVLPNILASMCARKPDPMALKFDDTTVSLRSISSFESGKPRFLCSVISQDSNTVNNKFVVIPPINRETMIPGKKLYCSRALIIISKKQYTNAEFRLPNLSTNAPKKGAVRAPAANPAA